MKLFGLLLLGISWKYLSWDDLTGQYDQCFLKVINFFSLVNLFGEIFKKISTLNIHSPVRLLELIDREYPPNWLDKEVKKALMVCPRKQLDYS